MAETVFMELLKIIKHLENHREDVDILQYTLLRLCVSKKSKEIIYAWLNGKYEPVQPITITPSCIPKALLTVF